ncbi:ZPBP2 protein, partial [Polypterus senegalus]
MSHWDTSATCRMASALTVLRQESLLLAQQCYLHHMLEFPQQLRDMDWQLYKGFLGYVDPLYSYSFLAQFRVAQCDSAINQQYLQNLLPAVKNLLLRVACRVTDPSMECHLMNEPGSDLQNKLFVSFTVDSFGKDWEAFCRKLPADCREDANQRVEQARQMLHNFFETEASVMKRQPGMYIQETRLSENRIASCPPGYGINSERHPECSVCCVACDPGTYSGKDSVTCEHCDSAEPGVAIKRLHLQPLPSTLKGSARNHEGDKNRAKVKRRKSRQEDQDRRQAAVRVPLVILANKQDLPGARRPDELVEKMGLRKIMDHEWHVQGCCAVSGAGIMEAVQHLTDMIKRNQIERH